MPAAQAPLEESAKRAPRNFPKHLVEIYDIDSTMLGAGAFSTVWRCTHRATGMVRAVKKIDTSELSPREIAHEIALMRLLRHENVVRCYDVFLEAQYVNIVVDMFTGGDLIDGMNTHHSTKGRIPDSQLSRIAKQMISAVAHVHSLQIVHRDVKGENFLSDRPDIGDPACRIALADFGTAVRLEPGEKLSVQVGTPAFWPPEVWAGDYDFLVDVWAVGVTTFILMAGRLPFESTAADPAPSFEMPRLASRLCANFLMGCLEKNVEVRAAAADLAEHEWMTAPPDSCAMEVKDAVAGLLAHVLRSGFIACFSCIEFLVDSMCKPEHQARRHSSNSRHSSNT